jgi:hypothetical protein
VSRRFARVLGNKYDRGAIAELRDVTVDSLAEAQMRLAGAFMREDSITAMCRLFIDLKT